jgi:hypothetical protein
LDFSASSPLTSAASTGTVSVSSSSSWAYLPTASDVTLTIVTANRSDNTTTLNLGGKTITFSSSTTSSGCNYVLTISWTGLKSGGAIKPLYWATGNLKYVNGIWSFYDTQFDADFSTSIDLFAWNTRKPSPPPAETLTALPKWTTNDPCKKVVPAGRWRLPTFNEALVLDGLDVGQSQLLQQLSNNKYGWWVGGDTDASQYLFLVANNSYSTYWTSTANPYNDEEVFYGGVILVAFGNIPTVGGYTNGYNSLIRCVSDTAQ